MKKIIIFGASGRVGQRLVEYALAENYLVSAFVRKESRINITNEKLRIVNGDVFHVKEVEKAVEGQDIVLSALSGRSTKPDYSVLSVGMKNIIAGMEKFGVRRILSVAGAGVLEDKEYGLRRNRPNYPEIFKLVSAENWKVYEFLQTTQIDWTMVCAPEMPNETRTGIYRTATEYLPDGGRRISVEDVADFMLKNIKTETIFRKRIGIAY